MMPSLKKEGSYIGIIFSGQGHLDFLGLGGLAGEMIEIIKTLAYFLKIKLFLDIIK